MKAIPGQITAVVGGWETEARTTMARSLSPAEWTYQRLVRYVKDFEKELDDSQEIGATLASFGVEVIVQVHDISYWGPDIITFHGTNTSDGSVVQLIQNIAQLSLLLVALPKQEETPRRIGFRLEEKLQQDGKTDEPPDTP